MVTVGTTREVDPSLTKPSTKNTIAPKMFNEAKKYVKKCPQC